MSVSKVSMLAMARRSCGISQTELAKRLGVTAPTISNWERNPEKLKLITIQRYYEALPELEDEDAKNFFRQPFITQC